MIFNKNVIKLMNERFQKLAVYRHSGTRKGCSIVKRNTWSVGHIWPFEITSAAFQNFDDIQQKCNKAYE
jgi:hypothetical protein